VKVRQLSLHSRSVLFSRVMDQLILSRSHFCNTALATYLRCEVEIIQLNVYIEYISKRIVLYVGGMRTGIRPPNSSTSAGLHVTGREG
jgi:hypothetical protein